MAKLKLTITQSDCRAGYHKKGDTFVVEDLCPPLCHELWNVIYPYVFALQNGAAHAAPTGAACRSTASCYNDAAGCRVTTRQPAAFAC